MSLSTWKAKAIHTLPLPSGETVKVRLPNVAKMVMGAEFPNGLREIALAELTGHEDKRGELTMEQLEAAVEFGAYVVTQTVLEPVLTVEDLDELPQEDIEALSALAKREVSIPDYLAHWPGVGVPPAGGY